MAFVPIKYLEELFDAFPKPSSRPTSSVYSDHFSLEDIAYRIDEAAKLAPLKTVNNLITESWLLKDEIASYRMLFKAVIELSAKVVDLRRLLEQSVTSFEAKKKTAEDEWLSYWKVRSGNRGSWI